ncbi:UNVERIFIED_CONTAM: hypothetical protein K2H54_055192 [Gekko kuhli]
MPDGSEITTFWSQIGQCSLSKSPVVGWHCASRHWWQKAYRQGLDRVHKEDNNEEPQLLPPPPLDELEVCKEDDEVDKLEMGVGNPHIWKSDLRNEAIGKGGGEGQRCSMCMLQPRKGRIWLIDFNPFGEVTDSLLFTWEEMLSGNKLKDEQSEGAAMEQDCPSFRCTNSNLTVQPSPYLSYRLPKDFVDLSSGEDVHKLIDLLKLKRNQQDDEET